MIGDSDSTSYRGHTRPFPFPQPGYTRTKADGYLLCRYPGYTGCAASPEFIPVHCDCCEIFKANCHVGDTDVLSRLWTFAAWKKPWRGTLPIHLANRGIDMHMLKTTAQLAGLPLLCKLPMELLKVVRGYSHYSLLWRCISALLLANRVSSTNPEPLVTMPLSQTLSWERNGSLSHGTSGSLPPAIRLTLNSGGISKIESISCEHRYSRECYDHSLFVVLRREVISDVIAQLQVFMKFFIYLQCLSLISFPRMASYVFASPPGYPHFQYGTRRSPPPTCPHVWLVQLCSPPVSASLLLKWIRYEASPPFHRVASRAFMSTTRKNHLLSGPLIASQTDLKWGWS